MKTKLFVGIAIFSTAISFAQEQTETAKFGFLTFNLTSAVVSYAPRWDVGYFHILNDNFTVGAEIGYGNADLAGINIFGSELKSDYELFELRPELIYTISRIGRTKRFVSAEFYYLRHTDAFTTSRYFENGIDFFYDSADYKRTKYGFNLNYGVIINFTKNFGMIPKFGFGPRFRNVSYSNVVGKVERPNDDDENHNYLDTDGYIKNAGRQLDLNLVFDIKLFFRL